MVELTDWFQEAQTGDEITAAVWNVMKEELKIDSTAGASGNIAVMSGSYFGHSGNADIHHPSSNITPWLDSVYAPTGVTGTLSGPLVGNIGANTDYGISGLSFLSSQFIHSTDDIILSDKLKHNGDLDTWIGFSDGVITFTGDANRLILLDGVTGTPRIVMNPGGHIGIDLIYSSNTKCLLWADSELERLGIKNISPSYDLDVSGSIYGKSISGQTISGGTIKFNTFAGTTNATAAEVEELTDGSETTLHSHASTGGSGQNYAYSYIIYKDGANYKAQDGTDGSVDSTDTDLTVVMNYATDSLSSTGGEIYVTEGTYQFSGSVYLYDNQTLRGGGLGTKFGFATDSDSEIVISGSHIAVRDFQMTGSGRIIIDGGSDTEQSDIWIENILARETYLSGSRQQGNAHSSVHNRGTFTINTVNTDNVGSVIHGVHYNNCHVISSTAMAAFEIRNWPHLSGTVYNVWYNDCTAKHIGWGNNDYSVGWALNEGSPVHDIYHINCIADYIWESGFHQEANKDSWRIIYDNCKSVDVGQDSDFNYGYGILAANSGTIIRNCQILNAKNYGISMAQGGQIIGCYIDGENLTERGIHLYGQGPEPFIIRDNTIRNTTEEGIRLAQNSGSKIVGNKLFNVGSATDEAIVIGTDSEGTIIADNIIKTASSIKTAAIYVTSHGIHIDHNTIMGCPSSAIVILSGYDNSIITNNYIVSSGRFGIWLIGSDECIVEGNRVENVASDGIYVNGVRNSIGGNIVVGTHNNAIEEGPNGDFNIIQGNMVSGASQSTEIAIQGDHTIIRDNLGFDSWRSSEWHNSSAVWDDSLHKWKPMKSGAGVATSPAGGDHYVQFNNVGSFGGDSSITWNDTTNTLRISGSISSQIVCVTNDIILEDKLKHKGDEDTWLNFENGIITLTGDSNELLKLNGVVGAPRVIVNPGGQSGIDFIVSSNTRSLIWADAGLEKLGIKNKSPSHDLDVSGTIYGDSISSQLLHIRPTTAEPNKTMGTIWMSSNVAGTESRLYMVSGDTGSGWKKFDFNPETLSETEIDVDKDWESKGIHNLAYISSATLSGSWTTPLYPTRPAAGIGYEGQIIRTSGASTKKTWVWICLKNDADGYEWAQLAVST